MGKLDLSKLENVKHRGNTIIARCPACKEEDSDHTGNHLIIYENGEFGCVRYQGESGHQHRQRIFGLAGVTDNCGPRNVTQPGFTVKTLPSSFYSKPKVLQKDILGRLGHLNFTCTRKEEDKNNNSYTEYENTVPNVPGSEESPPANDLGTKSQDRDDS